MIKVIQIDSLATFLNITGTWINGQSIRDITFLWSLLFYITYIYYPQYNIQVAYLCRVRNFYVQ